jgi:rod shape-determining protein MreC
MLKRPHYIALGLVVVSALIILNLPSRATARLKLAIGGLFVPLFGLANSTQQLAGKAGDAVAPRSELLKEIDALREQNAALRLKAQQAEGALRENERLRQLLGWQPQKRWKPRLANVVLGDPANWWRTVQIDLGSRDGARTNMPVLTTDGLVGRIDSVSLTRSRVVLLGDPNCKVAARVENQARDTGVIGAAGPLEREFVEMKYLPPNAALKPGQNVWTSGLGEIFPKDILIGKVVDSHIEEYGLYTVAVVRLAANPRALEEVWVMME